MNAKEAREIISLQPKEPFTAPSNRLVKLAAELGYDGFVNELNEKAKDFLEAVDKFKPVVEALIPFAKRYESAIDDELARECEVAWEALESYRRDVLGEK